MILRIWPQRIPIWFKVILVRVFTYYSFHYLTSNYLTLNVFDSPLFQIWIPYYTYIFMYTVSYVFSSKLMLYWYLYIFFVDLKWYLVWTTFYCWTINCRSLKTICQINRNVGILLNWVPLTQTYKHSLKCFLFTFLLHKGEFNEGLNFRTKN